MRTVIFLLFAFVFAGCTSTITKSQYEQKCKKTVNFQNSLTGQVYYQGSKGGFDYFLFEPFGLFSHHARVREGEVSLKSRFPFDGDRKKWVVAYPDFSWATNVVMPTAIETNGEYRIIHPNEAILFGQTNQDHTPH
jgi:hypothetical protein